MSPEQIEVERKAFEAWCVAELNYGYDLVRNAENKYRHGATETAWFAWSARAEKAQRAREALEGVAAILERPVCQHLDGPTDFALAQGRAMLISMALRAARAALKD